MPKLDECEINLLTMYKYNENKILLQERIKAGIGKTENYSSDGGDFIIYYNAISMKLAGVIPYYQYSFSKSLPGESNDTALKVLRHDLNQFQLFHQKTSSSPDPLIFWFHIFLLH